MFLAQMVIQRIDLVIIIGYLIGILGIGLLVSHKRRATSTEFFLAGKSLPWPMIGASLFAANISTIHLVGLASSGYTDGLVWGNFEWMASFCLIILGLVFAPFYFRSKISTLPQYLEKRYSHHSRTFLAFVAILSALLIHIGISLYTGAKVFEYFFNINVIYSIIIISVVTAIYTVIGGLKAVVVTETIQTFILLFGAITVTLFALFALPENGIHSFAQFKEALKPDQISMVHALRNPQTGYLNELSWFSVFFGYPVLGIWYWCSDQTIVQKVLGAKSQRDAQLGPLLCGFLKILPVFFLVLPGVLCYAIFKDRLGAADNNTALQVMISELIPTGLKGIIVAGLLAALMSTIAAALNSSATLVAVDIVKRIWPQTRDQMRVLIGRISAGVVMVLAALWSTQGGKFSSVFEAINKIPMIFGPAISCVFIWGVFWRRGTKQASLITLICGFIVGAIYFVIDLPVFGEIQYISDPVKGLGIPFMQVGFWLFCFCSVVYVTVSLLTPMHSPEQLENVCWDHPIKAITRGKLSGITDPRLVAGVLLAVMIVLYYLMA